MTLEERRRARGPSGAAADLVALARRFDRAGGHGERDGRLVLDREYLLVTATVRP